MLLNAEAGRDACGHCQSFHRADVRLSSTHLSLRPIDLRPRVWIWFWLSCWALAASSPPSRRCCWGTWGPGQEFALGKRTSFRHRCAVLVHRLAWTLDRCTPLSLFAAPRPPVHISHLVADEDLEPQLCLKFYLTDNPNVYLVSFFTPTHLSSVPQPVSVTHSEVGSAKWQLPF